MVLHLPHELKGVIVVFVVAVFFILVVLPGALATKFSPAPIATIVLVALIVWFLWYAVFQVDKLSKPSEPYGQRMTTKICPDCHKWYMPPDTPGRHNPHNCK